MKTQKWIFSFFLVLTLIATSFAAGGPEDLNPAGFINDFAGVLSTGQKNVLKRTVLDFEKNTSAEFAIVIVKSLGGYAVDDFAVKLAKKWGVGKRGKNNGIVLLLAVEDKESDLEIGYGLEKYFSDGEAKRVLMNSEKFFNKGDFAGGLQKVANEVIAKITERMKEESLGGVR